MLGKKGLGFRTQLVCEQGDAAEMFFAGKLNRVLQQPPPIAHAPMLGMHDDVLHEDDESALGGADGEKQVDHADDHVVGPQDKDAATVGLLQNEAQTMLLLVLVGPEIRLFAEKRHQQLDELWHVFNGCRLDARLGSKAGH